MSRTLFHNCKIFDGINSDIISGKSVLVEDGRIKAIKPDLEDALPDGAIDLGGRTLMPGLIDAHFHAYAADVDFVRLESLPMTYIAQQSRHLVEASLLRGFTTIRDVAGGDRGLWQAIEDGHVKGPRLFYGGRAFSQTGGHGDVRPPHLEPCGCALQGNLAHVVDGVVPLRKAIREELRQGAHHIKLFVSGGIASPSDPIWMIQYSEEELIAAVDEAISRRAYVAAHAYSAEAIERAVRAGVRSIEHGNLITPDVASLVAEKEVFVVPTLIIYEALFQYGKEAGAPEAMLEKLNAVREKGLEAIKICRKAGVKLGFGTDLLGNLHEHQLGEFEMRARVETPFEILQSATSVNAELLMQEGEIGCIREGALADVLVVNGDPLDDISIMNSRDGIALIMKEGELVKSSIA